MNEEGNAILKMLEEGKVSVEEATALLDAIRQPERPSSVSQILADSLQPNVRTDCKRRQAHDLMRRRLTPLPPKRGGARNGRGVGRKSGRSRDHGSGSGRTKRVTAAVRPAVNEASLQIGPFIHWDGCG